MTFDEAVDHIKLLLKFKTGGEWWVVGITCTRKYGRLVSVAHRFGGRTCQHAYRLEKLLRQVEEAKDAAEFTGFMHK